MFNITWGSGYEPRICLDKGRQAASEKLKPRVEERKEELSILSSSLQGFIWSFSLALDRTRFIKTWCRVFKLTTPSRKDFFFFFFSHASPPFEYRMTKGKHANMLHFWGEWVFFVQYKMQLFYVIIPHWYFFMEPQSATRITVIRINTKITCSTLPIV